MRSGIKPWEPDTTSGNVIAVAAPLMFWRHSWHKSPLFRSAETCIGAIDGGVPTLPFMGKLEREVETALYSGLHYETIGTSGSSGLAGLIYIVIPSLSLSRRIVILNVDTSYAKRTGVVRMNLLNQLRKEFGNESYRV